MRPLFPFVPVLIIFVVLGSGNPLPGQVREIDYSKRESRFSERMFPMREFSASVRSPESSPSRFTSGGDSEEGFHRFQRASHPDATRQVFESSRFSRADQHHRADGRLHDHIATRESANRFERVTNQRFSPMTEEGSPMLEAGRLQRVRENTLNQRFQSVVDRSLELSADNPDGGLVVEWERGIPYPRPRIALEGTASERNFSLEDINRFQFRSSRSAAPGLPVQEAGSGGGR